jgi:thymidylate kinase
MNQSCGKTVCIGGLISTGKSTFIHRLQSQMDLMDLRYHVMPELLSPTLCEKLPTDPAMFDAFMIGHRLQMSMDAGQIARAYDLVIIERCHIDHLAFMYAFEKAGWALKTHVDWTRKVIEEIDAPAPHCFVYLDISPELAYERMRTRNESRDVNFTVEMLAALKEGYLDALDKHYKSWITLDWTHFGADLDVAAFVNKIQSA